MSYSHKSLFLGNPGTALSSTGAETGTALDAVSVIATWAATVAETGNATDSPSALVTFAATGAETGTATDAPSAIETRLASVAETGTATDVSSPGAILNDSVAETGTATDAPSTSALLGASRAEVGSAADTSSGSTAVPARGYLSWVRLQTPLPRPGIAASVAESRNAVDTTSATGGSMSGSVAETGTAVDHPSGGGGAVAAIMAESGNAIDASSSLTSIRVYLSWADVQLPASGATAIETLAATDAPTAVSIRGASQVEVGSPADLGTTEVDARPTQAEALAAVSTTNAIGGASPAATAEVLSALDTHDGVGGVTPSFVVEAGTALDATDGPALLLAARAETLSAVETSDAIDSISAFESLTALDTFDGVLIVDGSIAEGTASAQDVIAAAVIWEVAVAEVGFAVDNQFSIVAIPPSFEDKPRTRITLRPKGARLGTPVGTPQNPGLG